jgi:hypothetical protein
MFQQAYKIGVGEGMFPFIISLFGPVVSPIITG